MGEAIAAIPRLGKSAARRAAKVLLVLTLGSIVVPPRVI
jgi:hypothetical protein